MKGVNWKKVKFLLLLLIDSKHEYFFPTCVLHNSYRQRNSFGF